jgi:hypothetical protein
MVNGYCRLVNQRCVFLAGVIVGLAFLSDAAIDMSMLCPILWQYVQEGDIQFEPDIEKLELWDPELARSFKWIISATDQQLADACIDVHGNHFQYIQCRIRDRLHVPKMESFRTGFYSVISESWIESLFSFRELSIIFGGHTDIDIEDWKQGTRYTGGYTHDAQVIGWFWKFVESLTSIERKVLLSFVTGMTRAPIGGFRGMTTDGGDLMPFTILRCECSPSLPLPTAATCFNLLKLPQYPTEEILFYKIHTAIRLGAVGFTFA